MRVQRPVRILALVALAASHAVLGAPTLDRAAAERLAHLAVGEHAVIDRLPDADGHATRIDLHRIDVYARDARIVAIDANGERTVPRSRRIHLIGTSGAGDVRVSLSFDPDLRNVDGIGTTPRATFVIRGEIRADGLALTSVPLEASVPAGVVPRVLGTDDDRPTTSRAPGTPAIDAAHGIEPVVTSRAAVVAVDTDNELMSTRFGNDAAAAIAWIGDLYAALNVMYQNDLGVTLLQGATFLRIAPDPYDASDTPVDDLALDEFGTYWETHYPDVDRAFAMLLSGKAERYAASGIAWRNAYCVDAAYGGSYSVTQVFNSADIGVGYSSLIVGHELGHNFGAAHTHCTDIATGATPVASNTIDACFSGEAQFGCYSGPESCPTSGPRAPAGTIMSYCNIHGCGPTGQNVAVFHPTQIATVSALIVANTPRCIRPFVDPVFFNGFEVR
jgi:hypothetical protein